MAYNQVSPPEPAELLYDCILSNSQRRIDEYAISREDIISCCDSRGFDQDSLTNIRRGFEIHSRKRCTICNSEPQLCACSSPDIETREEFTPKPEGLIDLWEGWIASTSLFREFEPVRVSESRWDIRARYGQTDLTLCVFFDPDDCREYDFDHESLEFGVYFSGPIGLIESQHVYSWFEFLESGFENQFESDYVTLQSAFGAKIYDYEPIDEIRSRVETGIDQYFENSGYTTFTQVGGPGSGQDSKRSATSGISRHIDPSKADLAAVKEGDCLVLCHCDRAAGWHIHRFEDGKIESPEDLDIFEDLKEKVTQKIDSYLDIQDSKAGTTGFAQALALFASAAGAYYVFSNPVGLQSFLANFLSGVDFQYLSGGLFVVNSLILALAAYVIFLPHVKGITHDWEFEPFGDTDGRRISVDLFKSGN